MHVCVLSKPFLARDAFVRTNRRATAMMFVRSCPSVCLGRACVVIIIIGPALQFSANLSLQLDSPMF